MRFFQPTRRISTNFNAGDGVTVDLGGCFCGKIRYCIDDGEHMVANCHCSMCRRISAAPFVTWILVPSTSFRYTQGQPIEFASSEKAVRHFCGSCGTPLAFLAKSRPDIVDVTSCSLDHPEKHPPSLEVHENSRLSWLATGLVNDRATH
ncbi:MAG: GFA family protein [Pseudohongiellaceae bacterium]